MDYRYRTAVNEGAPFCHVHATTACDSPIECEVRAYNERHAATVREQRVPEWRKRAMAGEQTGARDLTGAVARMSAELTGADIGAFLRDLRAIVEQAERERREYRYGDPQWMPLYLRAQAAQGIGYGVETARAWPSLLGVLVTLGAAQAVERVLADNPATIGDAWDSAKRLEQVPA